MLTPYNRYRPTRTSDGMGGFTESAGTAVTVYATMSYQETETRLLARRNSDIQKGDLIDIDGERYRVISQSRQDGTDTQSVLVEKLDRPV